MTLTDDKGEIMSKEYYEMKLPPGKTCKDCQHCYRCTKMFGAKETNTECDFYPMRFQDKKQLEQSNES